MEFFIRKGATDPLLKLRLSDDGRNDKSSLNDLLENADIRFDMVDIETEIPEILGGECLLTTRTKNYDQTTEEYYITYRFTSEQTKKIGKFEGMVNIQFRDTDLKPTNKLIVPIKEKLYINII
ncbi:hypothetical protein N9H34_01375 [bacterium]|nr:hypothetical protein [bacterium]